MAQKISGLILLARKDKQPRMFLYGKLEAFSMSKLMVEQSSLDYFIFWPVNKEDMGGWKVSILL